MKRGLKVFRRGNHQVGLVPVEESSPMKRGLKDLHELGTMGRTVVEESSPMKRGLKG